MGVGVRAKGGRRRAARRRSRRRSTPPSGGSCSRPRTTAGRRWHFGEAARFGTPGRLRGARRVHERGSLAPPDAPPVPPGEFMTAKAVAGSVTLAAVVTEPERATEKFVEFVKVGLEVAERTKLWATA